MIHIYTDGGCSGNPGPGGWAYVIIKTREPETGDQRIMSPLVSVEGDGPRPVDPDLLEEKWGAERNTTNNRMELSAVISALKALKICTPKGSAAEDVTLYTDSQYVQKGISEWIRTWKRNSWRTSDKKPVKNQDLWLELDTLSSEFSIKWAWVKGHAGDKYNERCDFFTQKAIASLK